MIFHFYCFSGLYSLTKNEKKYPSNMMWTKFNGTETLFDGVFFIEVMFQKAMW